MSTELESSLRQLQFLYNCSSSQLQSLSSHQLSAEFNAIANEQTLIYQSLHFVFLSVTGLHFPISTTISTLLAAHQMASRAGTMAILVALLWIQGAMAAGGWSSILTAQKFGQLFPNRNKFYTYASLTQAAKSYPAFGATGSLVVRKREVAAFLGNVMHETGELRYINEIGKPAGYCDSTQTNCPCASGKSYYGRGPLQISWNYNYCQAGKDLKLNLLQDPDQVARNAVTAWKTALWFWMSQPGAGNNCHLKMTRGSPSFGSTIKLINGMECGGGNSGAVNSRVQYYKKVCTAFGVDPGSNLYC